MFSCSFGQEWNEKYGAPIVVLIETDPWLMVIGSDVPTIAIYQYGDVIYKRIENKKMNYYSVKLDTSETQELIYSLGISDSLIKMADYTNATDWTDQPTNELILNFDSARVKRVYGNFPSNKIMQLLKFNKNTFALIDSVSLSMTESEAMTISDYLDSYRNDSCDLPFSIKTSSKFLSAIQ